MPKAATIQKISDAILKRPKLACTLAGALGALAMAPTFLWPALMLGLCVAMLAMADARKPKDGAWRSFFFAMGYFTASLFWVANALFIKIGTYWWLLPLAVLGLPFLLSICWFAAGWLTARFSKPRSLARSLLFMALIGLAEYARAFNLSGFPWNLFGYTWGYNLPMMQGAAIGGAYFMTMLTIFWMGTPALLWQAHKGRHIGLFRAIAVVSALSVCGIYAYGSVRLAQNPTRLHDDFAVAVIQPNITPDEKWEQEKAVAHLMRHISLSQRALDGFKATDNIKSVAILWPETALDETLLVQTPEAAKALLAMMQSKPYKVELVTGLWRDDGVSPATGRPVYYNSLAAISVNNGKLALDDIYNKHHLVPFGEYLPLEDQLNLTPLVGFAGFAKGTGVKTLHTPNTPPLSGMICFEAIFPWYAQSPGAEWIANTSNDGWYGNTPGPYQHFTMTRFRGIEQGKPIARSATTGISAITDSFGRLMNTIAFKNEGVVMSPLPEKSNLPTIYSNTKELLYFLLVLCLISGAFILQNKEV